MAATIVHIFFPVVSHSHSMGGWSYVLVSLCHRYILIRFTFAPTTRDRLLQEGSRAALSRPGVNCSDNADYCKTYARSGRSEDAQLEPCTLMELPAHFDRVSAAPKFLCPMLSSDMEVILRLAYTDQYQTKV